MKKAPRALFLEIAAASRRARLDRRSAGRALLERRGAGLPWVTLKAAITLDGKIATWSGDSRWVSARESRARVHRLRGRVDAVLIGTNTARLDNPRLTARLGRRGRNPVRVVLDSRLKLPLRLHLFRSPLEARTIVATSRGRRSPQVRRLVERGVEVWKLPARSGRIDLLALWRRLAGEGVLHLLVEGGAGLFGAVIERGLADELIAFVAPKLVGAAGLSWTGGLRVKRMDRALALEQVEVRRSGSDVMIRGLLANRRRFSL